MRKRIQGGLFVEISPRTTKLLTSKNPAASKDAAKFLAPEVT
jgi:hypothetical protein